MKKNKLSFETKFWVYYEIKNPFEVIDAFFDYAHLDYYKQILGEAILYNSKGRIYKKNFPERVFVFYTALRSFLKACYCLQSKSRKWKVKGSSENWSILHQASLTRVEYGDPFIVFQKAFVELTLDEFEFFLSEIVHLSLAPCTEEFDFDVMTPYLYLIKMLDASQLMRERGVEKIKKEKLP
ncbi:hypothetical protein FNW52_04310 [Flavobacterium sp. ZT3R18]|uniref:hypothetical protein n=1 Tax=Flavobacterium sp. ZT3R18 TaxID=2594429 RepID=UPI00117A3151|nr:hypothetical protein [Flavobacterium sp. ZT3R18]TRX38132.1 hypothetical protein FNW52_04310 [Flavobacterium sp. ZT3R18]